MNDKSNRVNVYIGLKIKNKRRSLGMNQGVLANLLCISLQQVQKYERGINRVSSESLFEIAKFFGVPVNYFFDGFDGFEETVYDVLKEDEEDFIYSNGYISSQESMKLLQAFHKIKNQGLRKRIVDLVKELAGIELDNRIR